MPRVHLRGLLESLSARVDSSNWSNGGALPSPESFPRAFIMSSYTDEQREPGGFGTDFAKRSLSESIDTQTLLSEGQKLSIQICAIVLSFLSLCCALVSVYWFIRMKKRFRHKLILILILADIMRSFWLFLFPVVYLGVGGIRSTSAFCQASGFLTQTGIEAADFAILFIAIHTALQVFHPSLETGPDAGLYRVRYFVYAFAFCLPPTLSSLAFIREPQGYLSQGPTCSLPIRPFWYRLAISWIPRYTIMLSILCIYVAIYIKVKRRFGGLKFSWRRGVRLAKVDLTLSRAESAEAQQQQPLPPPPPPDMEAMNQESSLREWQERLRQSESQYESTEENRGSSGVTTLVDGSAGGMRTMSSVHEPWMSNDMPKLHAHGLADGGATSNQVPRKQRLQSNALIGKQLITSELRQRQAIILRHVKLLFVYPLVYFILWLVPFIQHSFNYSNNRAQHPIFGLFLVSIICISSLGMADSIIFCLREKPWRHIPGSDNTFLGSFIFWKVLNPDNVAMDSQTEPTTMTSSFSQRDASSLSNRSMDMISSSRHSSMKPPPPGRRQSQLANLANVEEENIDPTDDSTTVAARDFASDDTPAASQTSAGSLWATTRPSHNRTPTREWFDRRLSVAVGRTSFRASDAQEDASPRTRDEEP